MINPLVSIITPTTHDRAAFNKRCLSVVGAQDYANIEHLMVYDQWPTLGEKMNRIIERAKGGIIVNIDSDDIYAPDWVSRCVQRITESGADVIGLKRGYFNRNGELLTYTYPPTDWCYLGATMCHTREYWQRNPYKHKQVGYDVDFTIRNCNHAVLDYSEGFIATIHGGNVSPKNTTGERWEPVQNIPTDLHRILTLFPIGS